MSENHTTSPTDPAISPASTRGKWMALTAALLGWAFDGLEMGLFPLAGRPALQTLLGTTSDSVIGPWFGVAMAAFLVGAATGGVLFGWLGDRIGRVWAMMLSVLCYALFTGASAFSTEAWHLVVLRFIAALGMGGEWSLGVALVNEIWPGRSRAFLAGLIGAAANVGFLLVGVVAMLIPATTELRDVPLIPFPVESWRLLMAVGAAPALLTFFIRIFVPESERWQREHRSGATSHWATSDLLGVLIGAAGACFIIVLWANFSLSALFGEHADQLGPELSAAWGGLPPTVIFTIVIIGSLFGLVVATMGFIYPVKRYLQRSAIASGMDAAWKPTIGYMLIGAGLSGVALLGTWGSIQWAVAWADSLVSQGASAVPYHKEWTQILLATGAIFGTILAALTGAWLGRRITYCVLCIASLAIVFAFFRPWAEPGTISVDATFLILAFLAGGITASFYGWLPLYLPELFATRVRATGQGFSFNFGRIIAAIGALQTGALMTLFGGNYPQACTIMSLVYVVGILIIWLAPETKGKPLPD